jgi:GT2 family glycosyltransferase
MIPVLIAPVLNRWDLAERMLASIDEPAERTIVVDNGGIVPTEWPGEVLDPLLNLGFSGAINAVIAQTPAAPWWLWASNDIAFGPGDLAAITALIEAATGPAVVTGSRADDRLLRFAYTAINRACIETVGFLDEWSFFPIYFEDDDYERRCHLAGAEWLVYDGAIRHDRSSTINSGPTGNGRTFPLNRERYVAKWGGPPGGETYTTPWNRAVPLSFLQPDLAGRAERAW